MPILSFVANGIQASGAERFVASKQNGFCVWSGFKAGFFDVVEENVPDVLLTIHRLKKRSRHADIRREIGEQHEEIFLAHFFDLIRKQSRGEEGHLLINGRPNIANIRDASSELWVACAEWCSGCRVWRIYADSVKSVCDWRKGLQVISRDS